MKSARAIRSPRHVSSRSFPLRVVLLITLAQFAFESTRNFYDAQVPPLLQNYVGSAAVIGLLMGVDNVVGIFLAPWIGARSDRTRTRWGRRLPYLVALTPVVAVAFVLLPVATSLPMLVCLVFVYSLATNALKPLALSLTPDFVAKHHRARATAIAKIATSLTIIVSSLVSLLLIDDHPVIAFMVPAALTLVAISVVAWGLDEKSAPGYQKALQDDDQASSHKRESPLQSLRMILNSGPRQFFMFVPATLLFFGAWAGMRSLITPYGTGVLGLSRGEAGALPLLSSVAFLLAAYPVAAWGTRRGHLSVASVGIGIFVAFAVVSAVTTNWMVVAVAMCGMAIGYAAVAVNAIVAWWGFAPDDARIGIMTGMWITMSALAQTLGPGVVGLGIDLTSWRWMFLIIAALAAVSLLLMSRTSRIAPTESMPRAENNVPPHDGGSS